MDYLTGYYNSRYNVIIPLFSSILFYTFFLDKTTDIMYTCTTPRGLHIDKTAFMGGPPDVLCNIH